MTCSILAVLLLTNGCKREIDIDYSYCIAFVYENPTQSEIEVFSLREPGHSGYSEELLFSLLPGETGILSKTGKGNRPYLLYGVEADKISNACYLQDVLIIVDKKDSIYHKYKYIDDVWTFIPAGHNICDTCAYKLTKDEKHIKEYTYTFNDEDLKRK